MRRMGTRLANRPSPASGDTHATVRSLVLLPEESAMASFTTPGRAFPRWGDIVVTRERGSDPCFSARQVPSFVTQMRASTLEEAVTYVHQLTTGHAICIWY